MIHLIYAFVGLILAGVVNWLADLLPVRAGVMQREAVVRAPGPAGWLALTQALFPHGRDYPIRRRCLAVELGMMASYAILPLLIADRLDLAVNSLYIAVLILIIVTDLEHRLIFNIVTYPMTLIAIGLAFVGRRQPAPHRHLRRADRLPPLLSFLLGRAASLLALARSVLATSRWR